MTKEDLAMVEWIEAMAKCDKELDDMRKKLLSEGRIEKGLDGNSKDYYPITQKLKLRLREIQEKYKD